MTIERTIDKYNEIMKERALILTRQEAHQEENIYNAKRKKRGEAPINTFPKDHWKLKDITKLKTFIVYDEIELLKQKSPPDLMLYLFQNMLLYNCNLIFNKNLMLEYNFNKVQVKVNDFHTLVPRYPTNKIPNCTRKKNILTFSFNMKRIQSLNKTYQAKKYNLSYKDTISRQFLIFDFIFFIDLMKKFSTNSKGFFLYLFEIYHHGKYPKIMHSLRNVIKNSGISMNKSHQAAIDRVNKYLEYLKEHNLIMLETYKGFFILEELNKPVNIRLNPLIEFKL